MDAEEFLEKLPELLRQRPELQARLYAVLVEEFPSRRETNEILREIQDLRREMDRRFEAMDRRFDRVDNRMEDIRKSVNLQVGGFQRRAGRNLEDMVAATLRLALGIDDIGSEDVKLRQRLKDDEGIIGLKGQEYEYDIVAVDATALVFEVKSAPDDEDVERFAMKLKLVRHCLGRPDLRGAMVTLAKDDELRSACERHGLMLV